MTRVCRLQSEVCVLFFSYSRQARVTVCVDIPTLDEIEEAGLSRAYTLNEKLLDLEALEETLEMLFGRKENGEINNASWLEQLEILRSVRDTMCDECVALTAQVKDLSGRGAQGVLDGGDEVCWVLFHFFHKISSFLLLDWCSCTMSVKERRMCC